MHGTWKCVVFSPRFSSSYLYPLYPLRLLLFSTAEPMDLQQQSWICNKYVYASQYMLVDHAMHIIKPSHILKAFIGRRFIRKWLQHAMAVFEKQKNKRRFPRECAKPCTKLRMSLWPKAGIRFQWTLDESFF